MNYQYASCCLHHLALLILLLLCTIMVLTEQAVAYTILSQTQTQTPTPSGAASASHFAANESLVEILPDDNVGGNSRMVSALGQERTLNQLVTKSLTPGQQVINALPDEERSDFIMHQLTVALQRIYNKENQQRFFKHLDDLQEYYGKKLTALEKVPIYENFPTDLLHWVGQEFNLSHQRVFAQLRSRTEIWCTPQGICYAYGSGIGCYCCPF